MSCVILIYGSIYVAFAGNVLYGVRISMWHSPSGRLDIKGILKSSDRIRED